MIKARNSKTALLLALALVMTFTLSGCRKSARETVTTIEQTEQTEKAKETAKADYTTGTPWMNPMVIGNIKEDTEIDLKDNFIASVCKDIFVKAEIHEGYSEGGAFYDRMYEVGNQMMQLMVKGDRNSSHDAGLVMDFYDMNIDWEKRNELGMEPIRKYINDIEAIKNIDDLNSYMLEKPMKEVMCDFCCTGLGYDPYDSGSWVVQVSYPELLLSDSDMYRHETQLGEMEKEAKTILLKKLLSHYGYDETSAKRLIDDNYAFEKYLADYIYTYDECNAPDITEKINNILTEEEVGELSGPVPVVEFSRRIGLTEDRFQVVSIDALKALAGYYTDEHIDELKAYMIIQTFYFFKNCLDRECYNASLECTEKMYGVNLQTSDEHIAENAVENYLSWAASRLFCDTYFTDHDKLRVKKIIDEIISAYSKMLETETFISEDTRTKAIEKLNCITVRCLYPDDWTPYEYSDVDFKTYEDGGNLIDAVMDITTHNLKEQEKRAARPVDKNLWNYEIPPSTVNAFYNPEENSINILAGITGGDLYRTDMSDEELYGSFGFIIAHEVSHAFDSLGAQYDKDGNFSDWWTKEDKENFEKLNRKIIDYFDGMTAWDGVPIKGSLLSGEACADMGSMACLLKIAEEKENFNYDVLFRSVAKTWAAPATVEDIEWCTKYDTHPLSYLRVNVTLQQFDKFNEYYGIKEGDGMYLAPEKRIAIW